MVFEFKLSGYRTMKDSHDVGGGFKFDREFRATPCRPYETEAFLLFTSLAVNRWANLSCADGAPFFPASNLSLYFS
jgi:hypothetical protein